MAKKPKPAQNLECYARSLGNCSGPISREHYVSEGALKYLRAPVPGNPSVYFRQRGVQKLRDIGRLTAEVLCTSHNSSLSAFDDESLSMVEASESVYNADNAGDQAVEVFQIDGDRLELWMLKTLAGGLYSGKLWPDLAAWQGKQPPIQWLEELYGLREISRGQGLFWQPTEMKGPGSNGRGKVEVHPLFSVDNQTVIGLHAWFFSFHFVLLVANAAPGTGFGSYRPAGLKVDGCNKRIAFKWKNGSEDAEITLGRCPLVATGSSKSRTLPESRLPVADQRKLSNANIVRMRDALRVFQEELGGLIRAKLRPVPAGSQAASELAASPDHADGLNMALDQAITLLESAGENLLLFAKGLDDPVVPIACLLNIRGVLEVCAFAVWLLDPAISATERISRGMGRRIEGMDELRKFAQAAKEEEVLAHALARLEHARQKSATTGIEPEKVPGSTEIIKRMLDFEVEYRLLSGVAHGQGWALMQAGYAIPETLPESGDIPATAKQIKPAFTCFAGLRGFEAITRAAWCLVVMFGLDRKRFSEIVDGFYRRFGGEPKGDLYWRVP